MFLHMLTRGRLVPFLNKFLVYLLGNVVKKLLAGLQAILWGSVVDFYLYAWEMVNHVN